MHKFEIVDDIARSEWENLLGYKINTDEIELSHEQYLEMAVSIQIIQLNAAFRLKFV